MNDDDMIRRGDALKIALAYASGEGAALAEHAIRAIPAAYARAEALKEAAAYHEIMAADEDALSSKYRGGSNPWFAHVQAAKWHRKHAAAILALTDGGKDG
ncbi:hypothetical protein UFOVP681_55 [uncultured Caudovirales phage]|uniref:Uncharacterized protein n=1 Tax=uncultured Caudovirales phage TaxID=2100421 RepID=A0A6J5NG77_9CAUD|nr:hypothetical protein UFOVP681_55 [uncultured Caudovirales phage]